MRLPKSNHVFSYYVPHKELSAYIAYYSIQHHFFDTIAPQIFPDVGGTIIISQYRHEWEIAIWGPFNRLTAVEHRPYKVLARVFIEFQPGGLSRLVYPNSNEILNQKMTLNEIDTVMHQSMKEIFERHGFTGDEESLLSALDVYFLDALQRRKDYFVHARHLLSLIQGPGPLDRLPDAVPYSTRQFNRYMNALVGVAGKGYMRVKRLNKAVELLKRGNRSIEQIADQLGYYDASHFVHDFTKLSGVTPTGYRMNKSVFYNDPLKKL